MKVVAHQGDTLDLLCRRHLGATAGVTEAVLAMNPGLAALGPILPMGTSVALPDAPPAAATKIVQLWD
ncbi:MAG: tail protein X [Pseudomonadota bacterium]